MGCCASGPGGQGVGVQDSFEGVLPDERLAPGATLSPSVDAQRCAPSTIEEYDAFLKMKAAALQEKGLIGPKTPGAAWDGMGA